jgi:aminopeptidase N
MNRTPRAADALDAYAAMFEAEPLALDKWFALQAQVPAPETLDAVEALTRHPRFSLKNPNRVRALIGAFATANLSQFHRADGAGYRFVGEIAGELDRSNPQVAARLLTAFRSFRTMEPGRREKARAVLEAIAARDGLSSDVADIVGRMLK